ncbi:hypothetical protein [Butyricicoccus sp. Marseille-Q5471]|uniref:hypothetical protein n=1 Tax=Butyricicoccus sp. Marseille-Q5471 TaxID=3039493 RepID=UPI0024BCC05D|nr:hypothetical protein [Butyricicoccus sp. Marseille-Q5471]
MQVKIKTERGIAKVLSAYTYCDETDVLEAIKGEMQFANDTGARALLISITREEHQCKEDRATTESEGMNPASKACDSGLGTEREIDLRVQRTLNLIEQAVQIGVQIGRDSMRK